MSELGPFIQTVVGDPNQVVVLGVILYTNEHPHIKAVLRNPDYWAALNKLSGSRWTILAARATKGSYEWPPSQPGVLGMMKRIWREPDENQKLLKDFHLENTERLPVFVAFAPLQDGRMLQTILSLDDSTASGAFNRLKHVVSALTSAVEKIDMENRNDYESVFNAVDLVAFNIKAFDVLGSGFKFYSWIRDMKS